MAESGTAYEINGELKNKIIPLEIEGDEEDLLKPDKIPVWLNNKFIQNILQKFCQKEDLKVKCLKIKQCGGNGDSYASLMFRIRTYLCDSTSPNTVQVRTLIVKTLPELGLALDKLGADNYNVQNKEMEMYQKVLPAFKLALESIHENDDFYPAVLAVDKDLDVIVLEDLAEKHFVMADRIKGLDMDHTLLALRKLARMHAASAVVYKRDPSAFHHLDTGFFTRKTNAFHVMFETLCDAMIEEVCNWDGYEHYAKKLVNVRKSLIKNAQKAFDCDEGDFHVLTHGDLWTNNLMYKYDDAGRPTDAVLLDFQFVSYGSPALDLIVRVYVFRRKKKFLKFLDISFCSIFSSRQQLMSYVKKGWKN